jgi:hypothetical protein
MDDTEITYTMIGADGAQYGPVTLFDFRGWISEGRVVASTKVMRSDTKSWLPASNYPELDLAAAPMPSPVPPPVSAARTAPVAGYDPALVVQLIRGAQWFYWIAALSVINLGLTLGNSSFRLIFGELGLGHFAWNSAANAGLGLTVAIGAYVAVAGIFALFGMFARKAQVWAFVVGGTLYVVDGLLLVPYQDWIGIALHAYVLYRIFMGFKANLALKAVNR